MWALHDTRDSDYRTPFGAIALGETANLALDLWDAPGATVMLRTWVDGKGEGLQPMTATPHSYDAHATRYHATLRPDEAGVVWYQFVIQEENGHETRYGAEDGRMGGEGRLCAWEPPSFRLGAFAQADDFADEARQRGTQAIAAFLRGERTAADLIECIRSIREDYPEQAYRGAFDLLGTADRPWLLAQLAGVDGNAHPSAEPEGRQLDDGALGLAKGRLWCAALVQLLMATGHAAAASGRGDDGESQLVEEWAAVDGDCSDIVHNALDLRRALPAFGGRECTRFAPNDDVFGFWRRDANGSTACVLVNASLADAHDILVPMVDEAVSDVIAGYGVPVLDASEIDALPAYAPAAARYARVHLHQLGTAVLHFHGATQLERPLQPGLGVLAHITSLPCGDGAPCADPGTLGAPARAFVDRIADAGARYWQVLPVNPTDGFGSPYAGISAFAGNVLLLEGGADAAVDVDALGGTDAFGAFCKRERRWLDPYAAFMAIRQKVGAGTLWQDWPGEYRSFDPAAIARDPDLEALAREWKLRQFAFDCQWRDLRSYANQRGVLIIGDMPLYVSADSADVWADPGMFQLDGNGRPAVVAGCPPDAFATEGQVWGNPVYDWGALARDGYGWWMRRLERAFELYDLVRLDHFIGFARYYQIPAGGKAVEGAYCAGPGIGLFQEAFRMFGPLPIVAEDLGLITPAVRALGAACGFPGMDVVQFADGNDPLSGYAPRPNKIAYTGTHDNRTLVGYAADRYPHLNAAQVADELLGKVAGCAAAVRIVPLQDLAGLGDEARMNVPGTAEGNWTWRASSTDVDRAMQRLHELAG